MKSTLTITLFLFIFTTAGYSQYYYGGFSSSLHFPRTEYTVDSDGHLVFVPKDMGVSLEAGAGLGTYGSGQSVFSTYLAPSFAYNVSERFRLKAGFNITNYFGASTINGPDGSPWYNVPNYTTSIFLQGDYLVNDKLMISGAVYKQISPSNLFLQDPRQQNYDIESGIVNFNYRPSQRFEINASIEYSNGRRNYLYSPFYTPSPFSSPHSSPLSDPFIW